MERRFEKFTGTITQIYRCIQKIKNVEMAELGLRGNHSMTLYYLSRHPEGLTASELCTLCGEDKAAVSRTVAELTARGYVCSPEADGGKKYRSKLMLTAAGDEVADRIGEIVESAVERGGEGLTEREREDFYAALTRISENLRQLCGENL